MSKKQRPSRGQQRLHGLHMTRVVPTYSRCVFMTRNPSAEFLEQLVYNMIFPQQTILHRDMLLRNDDESSLSSFGGSSSLQVEDDREWDFTTQNGIDDWITKRGNPSQKSQWGISIPISLRGTLMDNFMPRSGCSQIRGVNIATTNIRISMIIMRGGFNNARWVYGFIEKNQTGTSRCLVCNVNLCPNCMNEWHGINMQDTDRLLGK